MGSEMPGHHVSHNKLPSFKASEFYNHFQTFGFEGGVTLYTRVTVLRQYCHLVSTW